MAASFGSPVPSSRSDEGPTFRVGRDLDGHWLAVESRGLSAGLFLTERDAIRFAEGETAHRPGAVLTLSEPLRLPLPGAHTVP